MEDDETAKDTAIREIAEETGLSESNLRIIKFMTKINFSFVATYRDGNPLVNKDVYLFLVEYTGDEDPKPF
jgi:8-oxo-dGTP pyrophosphatase MutT (NUDIX family)